MSQSIFQKNKTDQVIETLKYVKAFCGQKLLIKISGSALEDKALIKKLCEDISYLRAAGISVVIVHGGGAVINEQLKKEGIEWTFHEGLRVTTPAMMKVIESVLVEKVNASLVQALQQKGIGAHGFSNREQVPLRCERLDAKLGEVGKVVSVKTDGLAELLDEQSQSMQGTIPVIAPIGMDSHGQPLNVNADWACVAIAKALNIKKIIFLTNEDGIYNQAKHLISTVDKAGLNELITSATVTGGMAVKCQTILSALEAGVEQIHIINGMRPHSLIQEIFTNQGVGTVCVPKMAEDACLQEKTF